MRERGFIGRDGSVSKVDTRALVKEKNGIANPIERGKKTITINVAPRRATPQGFSSKRTTM